LALLTLPDREQLIGATGFEVELDMPELDEFDASVGIQLALLSEVGPQPIASTSTVRNIVEVDDMTNPSYEGHDFASVSGLFPVVRAWKTFNVADDDSIWQIFLMISVKECQFGGSWIDDRLAEELTALAQLHVPSLPYRALCHSIFDLDPRSLFLALYRCIEATYAYETCQRLVDHLSLDTDWQSLAQALALTASWRPSEASSLQLSLRYALDNDLEDICRVLKTDGGNDLRVRAGRAIYDLRNRIVHYRPWLDRTSIDDLDWDQICVSLVRIVLDVFHQAFTRDSVELR